MFEHILVAIERSSYSQGALPTAIEVAHKFEGDIFVLHVSEYGRGRAAAFSMETPADATRLVAEAVKTAQETGISARGELREAAAGNVAKAIVEAASANAIDLIVMGSRGLSDIQGLLQGSVTHKVIHLADVPVLVDRSPARVKEYSPAPTERPPVLAY
jgi:nucleotide-binding universal stress UspA family protein